MAGVQVTPYSGAPGAWATVRIRGVANVTGNSQPLYVVDDVPVYNLDVTPENWSGTYGFSSGGNQYYRPTPTPFAPGSNPLLDLPVEDVASITVLKGAAATARYGMQGTNGVIRIVTRTGDTGSSLPQPLRVNYAGWAGVQQVRQRYDLLNARQYADLVNVTARNDGRPAPYPAAELATLGATDWQDQAFRTAGLQSHNLSVSGATTRTRYYAAADYLQQAGVLLNSGLSRYSLRTNVEQQLTARLSVGLKASGSQLDQRQPGFDPDAGPALTNLLLAPPATPARDSFGNLITADPLLPLREQYHAPRTRRLLAQLHAAYQLSPDLTLRVRGSHERAATDDDYHRPDNVGMGYRSTFQEASTTDVTSWVAAADLRYHRTLAENHALTADLSYLRQQYERELTNEQTSTLTGSGQAPVGTGTSRSTFMTRVKSVAAHSPTAQLGYTYRSRYEVQASLRTDFALGHDGFEGEYYWFPGAALRWHLDQEAFLQNATGLTQLTLEAGAGRTSSYFSPDRTTHLDAGLRLGLLGGRLTLDAAVYQRSTRQAQALLSVLVPGSGSPVFIPYALNMELLNRGMELTLGSTWQAGALVGTSTLALANNQNQVTDFRDDQGNPVPFASGLEKGHSISRFQVLAQNGTYSASSAQAGQRRFRDVNGDGRGDYSDSYYQGTGLPRYTLNFSQHLMLRRWQLDAQLDGLFGYQILNSTLVARDAPHGYTNSSTRALDYWTPDHQSTSIPRPAAANYQTINLPDAQDLASGNHVRLSQLSLSYEVLNTDTRKVSVWVGGQNLFVSGAYRGYDPNVSSGGAAPLRAGHDAGVYPVARVWQLGVRGQF
ncbi:TonB-dependent receptor [Hymenobacter algoricola]|uniref:TonB-dependent receptor n=1 Tax=Hymenobacter algoricola TaxID=486267 RepID=A0ABP7MCD6_9BACT